MTFVEALSKSKNTGLQKKLSKSECKSINRKQKRQEKQHMSNLLKENEALTFLANRKYFKQYDSERKTLLLSQKKWHRKEWKKGICKRILALSKKRDILQTTTHLNLTKQG